MVTIPEDQYLASQGIIKHYGTPRHSGRYPWGSGDNPQSQRNRTLLEEIETTKRKLGINDTQAARLHGVTTTELRDMRTVVRNERKQTEIEMARKLKEKGMSNVAIAKQMTDSLGYSIGDTQVGNLLKDTEARKVKVLDNVTNTLRKAVDEKGFIDVGSGVEFQLGVSPTKLRSALKVLKDEGYMVFNDIRIDQVTNDKQTILKVLAKPGTEWGDAVKNRYNVQQIQAYSNDGGQSILNVVPPLSISSKRVGIRYAEQGGTDADGVIYVRPGVKDVSLGGKRYAQVRIAVDGTHYIKGMAIYKDDLPDGVDLLFNTNKSNTGNKLDALKEMKRDKDGNVDPDNPFGASISRQIGEVSPGATKPHKLTSVMNLVNEEGDWDRWSKTLSSQFLSKQRPAIAKEQLDITYQRKRLEFEEIMRLNNPAVRRKLLDTFSDSVDKAAVHLKAANFPRQKTQVLLPVPEMKPGEVYAPNFKDGERIVLVRFPHGGPFEIPDLVVNNKNPTAKKLLGDSIDAVGIHPKVAERLSGADFDGDTVLAIPNNHGKVQTAPPLKDLEDFDPKAKYPPYDGMKTIDGGVYNAKTKKVDYGGKTPASQNKGTQMGLVSNLITDMTIRKASSDEIARAVKHSMVVIDAEKHALDYRRSAQENGIAALMKKYQNSSQGGASTLISRAKSPLSVPERKERAARDGGPIDPKTGKLQYTPTGRVKTWVDGDGKVHTIEKTTKTTKLAEATDAHSLSSGTVIETYYADHSNKLKSLANQARKELVTLKSRPYVPSARVTWKSEVDSLDAKINNALRAAPLERQAQVVANATVRAKIQANPELKQQDHKAELKRLKGQALAAARVRTGAFEKERFTITDREWDAIQAGAITANKLDQILTYADLSRIKELATPKTPQKLNSSALSRAKSMHARGLTWAEIAESLGVSTSTIQRELGNEGGD